MRFSRRGMRIGAILVLAAGLPRAADRGRVKVVDWPVRDDHGKPTGKTVKAVVDDQGQPLRGVEMSWHWAGDGDISNIAKLLGQHHMNMVRTYVWSIDSASVKGEMSYFDAMVDGYGKQGLYLIISEDGTAGPPSDERGFWRIAAAKYKDRTHVLYQIGDPQAALDARVAAPNTFIFTGLAAVDGFDYRYGGVADGIEDNVDYDALKAAQAKGRPALAATIPAWDMDLCEEAGFGWALWIDAGGSDRRNPPSGDFWNYMESFYTSEIKPKGLDWSNPATALLPAPGAAPWVTQALLGRGAAFRPDGRLAPNPARPAAMPLFVRPAR